MYKIIYGDETYKCETLTDVVLKLDEMTQSGAQLYAAKIVDEIFINTLMNRVTMVYPAWHSGIDADYLRNHEIK